LPLKKSYGELLVLWKFYHSSEKNISQIYLF